MAVAQLVESRIVIPVVVGSSPISHPKFSINNQGPAGLELFLWMPGICTNHYTSVSLDMCDWLMNRGPAVQECV